MEKYGAYLASPQWQRIRAQVLKRDRWRCRSCGRKAKQVHHGSYGRATMEGRDLSQLFSLCGECHLAATFTITGAKRTAQERHEMAAALNEGTPADVRKKARGEKAKFWCRCGQLRKKSRPFCGACLRGPTPQRGPRKRSIDEIRALSVEYAEGRMP